MYTEATEVHGKWPVEFQYRPARGDHRGLLVVFSSVGSKYGFGNALDSVQCHILRIRDHFDGGASYYVARDMDFTVSDSIRTLIESFMERLGVPRDRVTLLGASKGGSAALYYGLKYDFRNIVASTPQYFLGSYSHGHGQLGDAVLGEGQSAENVATMDAVMRDLLDKETDFDRNVYVVSSPGDYQYEQEVKHFLPALRRYENYNFLFVESPTVRRHDEVVRQGLPSILSIVYALTEGAAPRWGDIRIGPGPEDQEKAGEYLAGLRQEDTALAVLARASFADGHARLSGHAFIPGVSREGEAKEVKRLVLERRGESWAWPLESTEEIRLYRDYFDQHFCEYAEGGFRTGEDVTFESLPHGTFEASICVSSPDEKIERRTRLIAQRIIDVRHSMGDSELIVRGNKNGVKLTRRSVVGSDTDGVRFSLQNSWKRDRLVHAEGVFFLPGRNAEKKNHAMYYLVLQGRHGCFSFPLEAKKNAGATRPHVAAGDVGTYHSGYFSTPGESGVDVSSVPAGRYRMLVSMSAGGSLFTKKAGSVVLGKAG
ncbi:hypothetical protein [Streptomyces sp. AC512_CC834]|uniref:hypothetical protein n=1 Tax=Streptomyces sp. AC512_CC834 TaxID=2823691 RepID=UPI0027E542BA|nr:hypothetical protein [Streptomyces sp. AC512_CC834]